MAGEPPRSFGRNVAQLVGGTTIAQTIAVVASPVLARMYAPDAFGTFGVFLAVVSLGTVAVSLRYEAAIPLPERDETARALLLLSLLLAIGLSAVAALVALAVVAGPAGSLLGRSLREVLVLVPVALLGSGVQQAMSWWATRREAFSTSARASVAQGGAQAGGQLALGAAGAGAGGLEVGLVLGRLAGVTYLGSAMGGPRDLFRRLRLADLKEAAREYRRFPLVALWTALLNSAGFQIPILVLAGLFQAAVAGWFLLTVRVLQLPLSLIGSAVGQVYYARASRADAGQLREVTAAVFAALLLLGTGPMLLLAIGGPEGFAIVFGEAWRPAGQYAAWLAPWLLIVFVASPLSTVVLVLSRQGGELVFQVSLLAVRVAALVAGWRAGSADLAIALFGIGSAAVWAVYVLWLLAISGTGWRGPLRVVARELLVGAVLAAPLVVVNALAVRGLPWVIAAGLLLAIMVIRSARRLRFDRTVASQP